LNQANQKIFAPEFLRSGDELSAFLALMLKTGESGRMHLERPVRDSIGRLAAEFVRSVIHLAGWNLDSIPSPPAAEKTLAQMRSIGWSALDDLFSGGEIGELIGYLDDKPLVYSGPDQKRHQALMEALPQGTRFGEYTRHDTWRHPSIYRVVNDAQLINMIGAYLQAPPTISVVRSFWSFPNETLEDQTNDGATQIFHHDRHDFRSCNLFVYLTDVGIDSGPHAYIEKTHTGAVLAAWAAVQFANNPQATNAFWKWIDKYHKPDDEIARYFPTSQIKTFTGPKGTSFIADNRGLHKAILPKNDSRLIFQIVYTTLPMMTEKYVPLSRSEVPGVTGDESPLVKYATRNIYK